MSLGQAQLVRWSLPAIALIIGLLWYKRRRVDRVDPGGPSLQDSRADDANKSVAASSYSRTPSTKTKTTTTTTIINNKSATKTPSSLLTSPCAGNDKRRDSGINSDESLNASLLNTSTSSPIHGSISPRKVSESLDIPGRSSVQSVAYSGAPWYEDVEEEEDEIADSPVKMQKIELGSQPAKTGCDLLSKSRSSAELMANGSALKESAGEKLRQQKKAKVVKATGTNPIVQEFQPSKRETKSAANTVVPKVESQQQAPQPPQPLVVNGEAKKQQQQESQVISERDSANHSPVSGVLDGSVTDEARSEGSTDSGKGGSIKGGGRAKDSGRTVYDFEIHFKHVGKLIGRQGKFLQHVRNRAGVAVAVNDHPSDPDKNICSIEGTPENIQTALDLIRKNFPKKVYPSITLEQFIYEEPEEITWVPELMQLQLVEGVNNDVIVTHIIKPNHFFVQLPTHPTYPSLRVLDERMTHEYETVESPPVPEQLSKGMILVAKWYNKWVRVYVENPDPQGEETLVRLVDHGSYWTFSNSEMRKIRTDYLALPFQAIEVFLANIKPKDGEWTQEAFNVMAQLCSNSVGQAQIVGYVDYSIFINLFFNIHKHGFVSVADELIARGLAEPMSLEEVVPQEVLLPIAAV